MYAGLVGQVLVALGAAFAPNYTAFIILRSVHAVFNSAAYISGFVIGKDIFQFFRYSKSCFNKYYIYSLWIFLFGCVGITLFHLANVSFTLSGVISLASQECQKVNKIHVTYMSLICQ